MSENSPSLPQIIITFAVGISLGLIGITLYTVLGGRAPEASERQARSSTAETPTQTSQAPRGLAHPNPGWTVGKLRPNGLRIKPSGRSDASGVLDPSQFSRPDVRRAYAIAGKIPGMINKLYCWCKCENRGVHRSNLGCFEDKMAINCDVCRGTAEIAYRMMQEGETDAGKIQAAVDREWGPGWAKQEQRNRR